MMVLLVLLMLVVTLRLLCVSAMLSETEIVFSLCVCVSMKKTKKTTNYCKYKPTNTEFKMPVNQFFRHN